MTHRQFICWHHWIEQQYNTPSRADYYRMLIAREIRMGNVKNPNNVHIDGFKLTFSNNNPKNKKKKYTEEDIAKVRDKALKQWVGLMSAPVTILDNSGNVKETIIPPSVKRQNILKSNFSYSMC